MAWSKEQGAAPTTIGRRVTSLRAYAQWAGMSLLADYQPPSTPPRTPRPLAGGLEAINAMLEVAVGDDERCMVALCGYCALRISEARSVTRASFYFDGGDPWVSVIGKGYKGRDVPVHPRAWGLIEPVLDKRAPGETLIRLTDSQARKAWKVTSRRAGLGDSSTHAGRATRATDLLDKTGNLRLVQEVLGHASVATTQVYTNVPRAAIAAAMG